MVRESAGKDLNGKIYDCLDREYHECYLSRFSDPTHSESFMPAAYYYMQKQFVGGRARLCIQKRRRQPLDFKLGFKSGFEFGNSLNSSLNITAKDPYRVLPF